MTEMLGTPGQLILDLNLETKEYIIKKNYNITYTHTHIDFYRQSEFE